MLEGPEARAPRELRLAAFGKHPGWFDHMDELGLDTERLVGFRRVLYTEGINANVDSGAWQAKDGREPAIPFGHTFVWDLGDDGFVGRLHASTDGRGRSLYPVVIVVDGSSIPVRWTLDQLLPGMKSTEQQIVETTSAEEVRAAVRLAGQRVSQRSIDSPLPGSLGSWPNTAPLIADHPDLGPAREGYYRIVYQIERELSAFRSEAAVGGNRAQHLRVPRCADSPETALRQWLAFLRQFLHSEAPIFAAAPDEYPWVDLIVGPPTSAQFFCLRATLEQLPLSSTIPYTIDQPIREQADRLAAGN